MSARIAAVGDVHMDTDVVGRFRPALDRLPELADVLLLAGDLTRHGTPAEARCAATEFGGLAVPVIAVLGNHDYHGDRSAEVIDVLRDAGIVVLDGTSHTVEIGGVRVAVAGLSGFGGGFAGRSASAFGEPQMKAFTAYGREQAERLAAAFRDADGDAIDDAGCVLSLHGHAHLGSPAGTTPGGVPVRNVARPVIGTAYGVFSVAALAAV